MIYSFTEKNVPGLSEVGGKAKALIEMANAGLPVPEGFVLSVSFFQSWTTQLKSHKLWAAFLNAPTRENCDALKNLARQFRMNDEQREKLKKSMEVFSKSNIFAVRSSSSDEDLEGVSFAGGYETTLGVTYDRLEEAILHSFVSMLDFRVVEYKRKHGIQISNPNIAVIIQKQIASDVSGIGFSVNPQSGVRDEVMINSSFGLGEAIVSGKVTPDIYIVKENKIIEKKIASKHIALYLKDGGFTEERAVKNPKEESLSKKQVLDIADMIKKVENYYKKPMDIEWAIAGNNIYLLQARPITTDLSRLSWDLGGLPKGTVLARGGIGEQMPDPLSPLYGDYASTHVVSSIMKLADEYFGDRKILASMKFAVINGYGYYQFTMDGSFYWGFIKAIPKFWNLIKVHPEWVENEKLPQIKARLAELKALNLKALDDKELYNISHELTETICTYYTYCQIYLAQAYTSEGLFIRYYDKKIKPKVNIPSHVFMLGEDTEPILADKALYKLAREIRVDNEAKDLILTKSSDEIMNLMGSGDFKDHSFCKKFRDYLDVHGNMVYDLDFSKPTPHDDPRPILETLKMYVEGRGNDPVKRQKEALARRKEAENRVKEAVSSSVYKKFMKKLEYARSRAPFRENGLANLGICQPFLREVLFELGLRLKRKGVIKTKEDIFWVKEEELKAVLDGQNVGPHYEKIAKRKALWKKQRAINPPMLLPKNFRVFGIKASSFLPKDLEEQTEGNKYEGIAVSSGKVTGKARVILSPEEFGSMKQGEILVASMTTPAWTPLFAMAAGIVTDYGGPLSHSSIVAREYGIPAVLGTGGLSKIIKSGQIITVDGDKGFVVIEEGRAHHAGHH